MSDVDAVFYFPFDWAFTARRTLNVVRPRLFVMIETEIWPNLLRECRRRRIKTVMVNGRISHRSFPRYRMIRPFIRRVLGDIDRFCVQGDETSRRLVELGADPARITVTGSLKFDSLESSPTPGRGPRARAAVLPHPAEPPGDHRGQHARKAKRSRSFARSIACRPPGTNALLIIAARHPERFDEVERLCRHEGLVAIRRTELPIDAEPRADAVVLDTIGELAQLYQLATVVFVGGSLVPAGGHNILEPALYGKADRLRPAHAELR